MPSQLGFSGGEPLLRDDLEILVAEARRLGFYSNLITSGCGIERDAHPGIQGRGAWTTSSSRSRTRRGR